jgi:hypothetical protein
MHGKLDKVDDIIHRHANFFKKNNKMTDILELSEKHLSTRSHPTKAIKSQLIPPSVLPLQLLSYLPLASSHVLLSSLQMPRKR